MLKVTIIDKDLNELIMYGQNKGKYKKLARDAKFVNKLISIYNLMKTLNDTSELKPLSYLHYEQLKHTSLSSVRIMNGRVERLIFKETEDGLEITLIELNQTHYGNKK